MTHRKTVRHFHEVGHLHELTFSCYRRMPLLTNDTWREKLARCVDGAGDETAIQLVAWAALAEPVAHFYSGTRTVWNQRSGTRACVLASDDVLID